MSGMWRRLAALVVALSPALVAVPLVASWRDRLPAELATHWSAGATPDDLTARDGFLDGWVVFAVAAGALGVLVTLLAPPRGSRIAVTVTGVVMGLLAALGLMIALPNLDLSDPEAAQIGWEAALPLPLMVGAAGVAWLVHGRPSEPARPADSPPPPDLPRLTADEPAYYNRAVFQWWLAATVLALLGSLGVLIWVLLTPWLGAELVLLGIAIASFGRIRVRVSEEHDLTLSSGFVAHRIPIAELTGARPRERVEPFSEFGGWGLRYRPGAVGLVERAGPGVEVSRTRDRRVVITTDEPQRLAAVINTLADQRSSLAAG